MLKHRTSLLAVIAALALSLTGASAAWACGGDHPQSGSGDQSAQTDNGSQSTDDTTTQDDNSSATDNTASASRRRAARRHHRRHRRS